MEQTTGLQAAKDLIAFIDASPSPWHAAEQAALAFEKAGFRRLHEGSSWELEAAKGYYVIRDGSSIIAFRTPKANATQPAVRAIAAHTDSPGFRIKPNAYRIEGGVVGVNAEIYGSPIIPTFADRELTLAGRVVLRANDDKRLRTRLVHFAQPLLRLPTPAIHLNRDVNEQGLKFQAQDELLFVLGEAGRVEADVDPLRSLLAGELNEDGSSIIGWELAIADAHGGTFFGMNDEFIASARLDNLASCHACVTALCDTEAGEHLHVCALFDHEEVGSESYKGADGGFLESVILRVLSALGYAEPDAQQALLARGLLLSVDMAHGFLPNFAQYYDRDHKIFLNSGPAIKINAKQRYATDSVGEAFFAVLCEEEQVPYQRYVHRNNLPCGSTIGPIVSSRLGIRTVDVGNPLWSMHSARETAGVRDQSYLIKVLARFLSDPAQFAC